MASVGACVLGLHAINNPFGKGKERGCVAGARPLQQREATPASLSSHRCNEGSVTRAQRRADVGTFTRFTAGARFVSTSSVVMTSPKI